MASASMIPSTSVVHPLLATPTNKHNKSGVKSEFFRHKQSTDKPLINYLPETYKDRVFRYLLNLYLLVFHICFIIHVLCTRKNLDVYFPMAERAAVVSGVV